MKRLVVGLVVAGALLTGCRSGSSWAVSSPLPASSSPSASPQSSPTVSASAEKPAGSSSSAAANASSSAPASSSDQPDGEATAGFPASYKVKRLDSFAQYAGKPGWAADERAQVTDSVWSFDQDGTFTFSTSGVRTDLFPLHGLYQSEGSQLTLAAHASSAGATGSAHAELAGTMDTSVDPPTIRFRLITAAGNGAVVDGHAFNGASAASFGGTIALGAA